MWSVRSAKRAVLRFGKSWRVTSRCTARLAATYSTIRGGCAIIWQSLSMVVRFATATISAILCRRAEPSTLSRRSQEERYNDESPMSCFDPQRIVHHRAWRLRLVDRPRQFRGRQLHAGDARSAQRRADRSSESWALRCEDASLERWRRDLERDRGAEVSGEAGGLRSEDPGPGQCGGLGTENCVGAPSGRGRS